MTYPPVPPPAPPAPVSSVAAPRVPGRGLPWWGWVLLGLGVVGIAVTAVFSVRAMIALVAPGSAPVTAPGTPSEPPVVDEEPETDGVVYESADFPFEVTFPGEPTREVIDQAVVGFDLQLITVTWNGGGRSVILGSTEFPADLLPGGANDDVLQGSLDGAAANVGGTIVDQEFIDVDGQRAISGVVTAAGSTLHVTVFFRDSVQYSMISENGTEDEHAQYVASFRFTA